MADQTTTIPNGWKMTTLGQQIKVGRGSSPRPIQDFLSDNGIPWVKIADASASETRYIEKTKEFIRGEGRSTSVKVGDLIVSNSATPGIPKFMGIDACVHDGWLVFSEYKDLDKLFLYYFFLDYRRTLEHSASGTVFVNLQTEIVRNIEIKLPPLPEQRAIAAVLSSLDDKIELLREQNKTLEATAQAIFKEWFVNFNFPGATGKMIDSELGEIPEGWSVVNFDEIMKFTPGTYIPKEDYEINGDNFIYGSNSVMGNTNQKTHTGPIIILAKIGTYCGAIRFSQDDCWINNNAGGIQGLNISTAVIFEILKHFDFSIVREGSGQPYINMSGLKMQKVAIPKDLNSEILKKISQSIDTIYLKIAGNQKQIQILSKLRDTLLPKLIKGEVRIKEFDR